MPTSKLKKSSYRIPVRDPLLWSNFLTAAEKSQERLPKFRTAMKLFSNEKSIEVKNHFFLKQITQIR